MRPGLCPGIVVWSGSACEVVVFPDMQAGRS